MKSQYITPVVSLFDAKGRVDKEENTRVYSHLLKGGVSGFVTMGSTGEFYNMSMNTAKEMIDVAASFKKGSMRVFAGASRMDPTESVELANYAHEKGLDGVMIISPYYFPLTDQGVYDFYSSIAPKTASNIFIYNFPDRTGYTISPATTLKLVQDHKNITGFKDTILDMAHTSELIKAIKPEFPEFEIFSGFDNNFAHNILSGGNGCIGGLSNIIPEFFAKFIAALDKEDMKLVSECQHYVDQMMDVYAIASSFIPVLKNALKLRGVTTSEQCNAPFKPVTSEQAQKIEALLAKMNIGKA